MSEYTPTTQQVRDVFLLGAIDAADGEHNLDLAETLAMFDRWLNSIKAEVWDEGVKAGLDTGLTIAENVHEHGGTLDLSTIPNSPVNPYRLVAELEGREK